MGTATDMQKCTMSCWVKKESLGFNSATFFGASTGQSYMNFVSGNEITLFGGVVSGTSGTNHPYMKTNATYGSTSDWYHIVVQVDTTQGTATDREKLYVDGTHITSFSTSGSYQSVQNQNSPFNQDNQITTIAMQYFTDSPGYTNAFDGLIAEPCFVDGAVFAPSAFGVDVGGTWSAIDPRIAITSFGNNGYYLRHQNAGALGEDSSGQGNTFTLVNSPTQSTTIPPFSA